MSKSQDMKLSERVPSVAGVLTPDFDLAKIAWLRVGGPAELLFQPADIDDLQSFLQGLDPTLPVQPIGMCSNLIIRDGGVDGVVIRLGRNFNDITILEDDCVQVGAAALDAHVARKAAQAGLDLAFLRTIPGAIGGAIKMNAGCYGSYLEDVFVSARAITRAGEIVTLSKDQMDFSYRSSWVPDDMILIDAILKAPRAEPAALEAKMQKALDHRAETQPIKDRSAGSTFRNPAGFSSTGKADDSHELKAWKVIDEAGLRGFSIGGAQMSEKHPNFMINMGEATAADLEELGEYVRKKVAQTHEIQLEWEIKRVGKAL